MRVLSLALVGAMSLVVARAAQAQTMPNPLEKAKEGQWVLSKSQAGGMTSRMYQWVSKVEGKKITLRTQILNEDGKTAMMAGTDAVIDLSQTAPSSAPAGAEAPKPTITDDEVELKGKKVKCKKIEVTTSGIVSTSWMSDEVPIMGLVKSVAKQDGKELSSLEVVDFGQTGGADKPVGTPGAPSTEPQAGGTAPAAPSTEAPAAAAKEFAVGDEVGAKWVNPKTKLDEWYLAKILSIKDDQVAVEYGDGELGKIKKADLRRLVKSSDLKAGDRVYAAWNGKPKLWAGTVESTTDSEITVKWDDGSPVSSVPSGHAFKE